MKPIVFFFFLILCNLSYSQSSFADGYKDGYKKGYCLEDIGCVPPIAPIAPIPAPGYSTYSDGYARGVQAGQNQRQTKNMSSTGNLPSFSGDYQNPTSTGAYQNPTQPVPTKQPNYVDTFNESFNQTIQIMESMYANIDKKGTATYFPSANSRRPFKKLQFDISAGFGSLNIPIDYTGKDDPMYLGQKLVLALRGSNLVISPYSPYTVTFQYRYRADTGCGGVVMNRLQISISDTRTNKKIANVSFKQGSFEGKCIDDVVYQTVERFISSNNNYDIGEYETFLNTPIQEKTNTNETDKDFNDTYAELKKLKELLDLGVLTQEEYDKKANQLKSKILDN